MAQIEAALGRDLLPALRYQRGLVGSEPAGDLHDLRAGGQLHVEHPDRGPQPLQVVIMDMAPVLPQMRGDAVRAGGLAEARGLHRIGLDGPPSLAHRGHVIHVDVEPHRRRRRCPGFREGLTSLANICQVRDL
jgi:hypothetical protein